MRPMHMINLIVSHDYDDNTRILTDGNNIMNDDDEQTIMHVRSTPVTILIVISMMTMTMMTRMTLIMHNLW